MLMINCFPSTHVVSDLFSILTICVIVSGMMIMAYTVFNGMYVDSISLEESDIDNNTIDATQLDNHSQDLTLSKLFNKNK